MKRIMKYIKVFILTYIFVFVATLLLGKFSSFRFKDPIVLVWDELFADYLNFILILPLVFATIAVYGKWDDDRE